MHATTRSIARAGSLLLTAGGLLLASAIALGQARDAAEAADGPVTAPVVAPVIAPVTPPVGSSPAPRPWEPWVTPQDQVVWDNGPFITSTGIGANGADVSELQTILGGNTMGYGIQREFNNRIADDFTITGQTQLTTITFFAYQNNSTLNSTINRIDYRIWDGPPGNSDSNILFNVRVAEVVANVWSGAYRVTDLDPSRTNRPIMAIQVNASGIVLEEGTYWIDWQMDGALDNGPWSVPVTYTGRPGAGNARQFFEGRWIAAVDGGIGWQDDFPFIIRGGGDIGFEIFKSGVCPGLITINAQGATPDGRVIFVYGTDPNGTREMPPGRPCAGTLFDLADARSLANRPVVNGVATVSGEVSPVNCGQIYVQAIDLSTCRVSSVLLID